MFSGSKTKKAKLWLQKIGAKLRFIISLSSSMGWVFGVYWGHTKCCSEGHKHNKLCCFKKLSCPDLESQLPVTWLWGTKNNPTCLPSFLSTPSFVFDVAAVTSHKIRPKCSRPRRTALPVLGGLPHVHLSWQVHHCASNSWRAPCTQSLEPSETLQSVWTPRSPPNIPPPSYTTPVLHQHISGVGAVWLKLEGRLSYGSASG